MPLLLKTLTEPLDRPVSLMVKYLVKLTNKDIHCKSVFNHLVPGVDILKKPEFVNQRKSEYNFWNQMPATDLHLYQTSEQANATVNKGGDVP